MASALALQCSTNWAMKTHMLGADRSTEFIFTRDRKETWNEVNLSCGNTVEIEMWARDQVLIHIKDKNLKFAVCCYYHQPEENSPEDQERGRPEKVHAVTQQADDEESDDDAFYAFTASTSKALETLELRINDDNNKQ